MNSWFNDAGPPPEDPAERGAWRHGLAEQMDPELLMATMKLNNKRLGTKAWNIQIHKSRRQRQQLHEMRDEQVRSLLLPHMIGLSALGLSGGYGAKAARQLRALRGTVVSHPSGSNLKLGHDTAVRVDTARPRIPQL